MVFQNLNNFTKVYNNVLQENFDTMLAGTKTFTVLSTISLSAVSASIGSLVVGSLSALKPISGINGATSSAVHIFTGVDNQIAIADSVSTGLEIGYSGVASTILGYRRGAATYTSVNYNGLYHSFQIGGSVTAMMSGTGMVVNGVGGIGATTASFTTMNTASLGATTASIGTLNLLSLSAVSASIGALFVGLTITASNQLLITHTNLNEPIDLYRNSGAVNDLNGINFSFRNADSAKTTYAGVYSQLVSNTTLSESGRLLFFTRNAGTNAERAQITHDGKFGASAATFTTLNTASLGSATASIGSLAIGNAVSVTANIANTHRATISIGGSTYFILLTNVA